MSPVVMFAALRASAINSSPVGLGPEPEATDSEAVEAAEASEAGAWTSEAVRNSGWFELTVSWKIVLVLGPR